MLAATRRDWSHAKAAGRHQLTLLTEAKAAELAELMEATNPANLTSGITAVRTQLIALAAAKHGPWKHQPREQK